MDTVMLADRMFVSIVSCFFGFIAFFGVSWMLLLGGVGLLRKPDRHFEKKAALR